MSDEKEVQICPLMSIVFHRHMNCLRELCAWWDPDIERCVLFSLQHLYDLSNILMKLEAEE